jgi:hypothetical protein
VIDQLALPKLFHLALQSGCGKAGKLRYRLDIDIKRVEEQPAVRRIRACGLGMVIEQSVQRVEGDARSTELARKLEEAFEVGEVTMTPVAPRPHPIKLHGERPQTPGSGRGPLKGPTRGTQERRLLGPLPTRSARCDLQPKRAERQIVGKPDAGGGARTGRDTRVQRICIRQVRYRRIYIRGDVPSDRRLCRGLEPHL